MLTYFDESYDSGHNYLLLGALFNPRPKELHRAFRQVKLDEGFVDADGRVREVKYNLCKTSKAYRIATGGVACFRNSDSIFRCVVVDQRFDSGWNLNYFGRPDERSALKEARAYKRFTELLLRSNSQDIVNGVLLTDRLTHCHGDEFIRLISESFGAEGIHSVGKSGPTFRHVAEVDTAQERYQLGQICDILTGSVLNELVPTTGKRGKYKVKLRESVKQQLALPSLSQEYWGRLPKYRQDILHPKFQIWYWQPN